VAAGLILLALAGCAAQASFREGNTLLSKGQTLDGMAKLEEASRLAPDSVEYRMAYLQSRDRYAQRLVDRADAARVQGRYDEAEHGYRQALLIKGQQDRAQSGLRLVEQERRLNGLLSDAKDAIARKDWEVARSRVAAVLRENGVDVAALALMRQIERETAKPRSEPVLSAVYKRPITVEFKDVPIRNVFEVISRTSQLNFLFDRDVKTDQRTSIYLRNSTVEAAVSWLLLTNHLEQRILDGSTVLIYPATPDKRSEYQPLTVKSFYLANADAKTVAGTLKSLLKSKDVVVDEKLNLVILRDTPDAVRLAEKIVALHDVPDAEVMLEVEILEIKRDRLLNLGVTWPDHVSLSALPTASGGTLTLQDLRNPTRSMVGVSIGSAAIDAQKQDSDSNLLANPRIRVRNREKAKIMIGEHLPTVTTTSTATGFIAESVNYVDVGLKLDVEPTIYLDNEVAIKIALDVSSISAQQTTKDGSIIYQLGTRNAQTVLRLKDGENQILAGLINNEERHTAAKLPGLGELPIVGRLFGDQSDDTTKTEIVLSITPRILRNIVPPDSQVLEFGSGTSDNLRPWPSDAGTTEGEVRLAVPTSTPATATPVNLAPPPVPVVPNGAAAISANGTAADHAAVAGAATLAVTNDDVVAGLTQTRWEGPTQVRAGEAFSVQLLMQSGQPVVSMAIQLGFDPKVLQVLSIIEGGFLRDGDANTTFSQRVDADGSILVSNRRIGAGAGATAPGVVTTLNLKVLPAASAGATQLKLHSIVPTGVAGTPIAAPTPAPLTVSIVP